MEDDRRSELRSLVALAHVASVPESIAFYRKLGFEVKNTFTPPEAKDPAWVWLEKGNARLMLSLASAPILPEEQAVLFYLYYDDIAATRRRLDEAGVTAGPIEHPFYNPRGEFRVTDPDGYVLMLTHT
ncbi:MAG TPA: VOC family protein [Thermoanaerobaculia bacterium]|nr:VOC family protein [Thermoanaerobaculia bacterium]